MKDEDYGYEQWRQRKIERDWNKVPTHVISDEWDVCNPIPCHQKVGTVIPFSRTADRDPNPRIPLSVPDHYPHMQHWEWVTWALLVGFWAMLVVAYNMGWLS